MRLKPDARPVKAMLRRYPPLYEAFLEDHVQQLLETGLVKMNSDSRWASAPRVVPKKSTELRMTADQRAAKALTDPLVWPMPDLESDLSKVEGSKFYFDADVLRCFYQLPLHSMSQEIFTTISKLGMVTPTRVPMGTSDSVAFCQQTMEPIVGPLLYKKVLVRLDDVLGFAKSPERLLDVLEAFLQRCEQFGLKLHPRKCHFFMRKASWCGKVISADGVAHSPEHVQGLVKMASPWTAAGDLQQFLCAVGWMR
ncbi:unnamed protein product [Phytophthora fragariaefolia]|uniref:Unnamed protein product n=1 Tax=Phytophthora fragariaefolia TaxID=1490495 RepID=A0A9W6Y575_9STRA|nr:unnamed protein product [Phytophthora fragariaefolia]